MSPQKASKPKKSELIFGCFAFSMLCYLYNLFNFKHQQTFLKAQHIVLRLKLRFDERETQTKELSMLCQELNKHF